VKSLAKERLRKKILKQLRIQKEETRLKKSKSIAGKLFRLPEFKKAKKILFYISFDAEVQTREMIKKALAKGKQILVPVCKQKKKKIVPCFVSQIETGLMKGAYGISEPKQKFPGSLEDLDLIIVPGLAFDKEGRRLGRGLGYYDRFLKTISTDIPKIGLAFRFQVLSSLAKINEPQDFPVDKVLFA
jgi:5-formyltetrahydrofolate cyclo-ligase